jgi:uncharacterized protein YqgV (UPF0045/DUF77 family)
LALDRLRSIPTGPIDETLLSCVTMQNEKLQTRISELEKEVSALETLDEESRQRLLEALREIHSTLGESGGSRRPQIGRLQDVVQKFEGSHPTLTLTLSRLLDALAEIGI